VIFLDTGFLFALVSKRDAHHERVVDVFREFKNVRLAEQLVTTNYVIAETITLTLKVGHEQAVNLGDQLYGEKRARIHWATPHEERAAFDYFKRHQDQTYAWWTVSGSSSWRSSASAKPWRWTRTSLTDSLRGRDHCEVEPAGRHA
jgi:predicted nucleic acid-binding protein